MQAAVLSFSLSLFLLLRLSFGNLQRAMQPITKMNLILQAEWRGEWDASGVFPGSYGRLFHFGRKRWANANANLSMSLVALCILKVTSWFFRVHDFVVEKQGFPWPWEAGVLGGGGGGGAAAPPAKKIVWYIQCISLCFVYEIVTQPTATNYAFFFLLFFKTFFRKIISDVSIEENRLLTFCIHRINLH